MSEEKTKIMIVDDHKLVRVGLRHLLLQETNIEVVAEAESGEEAVELARKMKPDVVLLDIQMPNMDGLEATKRLLRIDPYMKIIIITVCEDNNLFPSRLLQAGAYGYLTKDASVKDVTRAIKTVLAGQRYISPKIASKLAIQHLTHDNDSPFEQLSEREIQVVLLICKGKKVSYIADQLCLSPKTVNSYRYRVFDKLSINNDVELTLLAAKHRLLGDVLVEGA
jgi:two-component system invasion response regulator UvrY